MLLVGSSRYQRRRLGSIPSQVMRDLWLAKWNWGRFPLPTAIPPTASYSLIMLSSTLCSLDIDSFIKKANKKVSDFLHCTVATQ
jgi:hypothetical protein